MAAAWQSLNPLGLVKRPDMGRVERWQQPLGQRWSSQSVQALNTTRVRSFSDFSGVTIPQASSSETSQQQKGDVNQGRSPSLQLASLSLPEKPLASIHRRPLGQQWLSRVSQELPSTETEKVVAEPTGEFPAVQRQVDESSTQALPQSLEPAIQRQALPDLPEATTDNEASSSLPEKPLASIHRRPLGQQWLNRVSRELPSTETEKVVAEPTGEFPAVQRQVDESSTQALPQSLEPAIQRQEEQVILDVENTPTHVQLSLQSQSPITNESETLLSKSQLSINAHEIQMNVDADQSSLVQQSFSPLQKESPIQRVAMESDFEANKIVEPANESIAQATTTTSDIESNIRDIEGVQRKIESGMLPDTKSATVQPSVESAEQVVNDALSTVDINESIPELETSSLANLPQIQQKSLISQDIKKLLGGSNSLNQDVKISETDTSEVDSKLTVETQNLQVDNIQTKQKSFAEQIIPAPSVTPKPISETLANIVRSKAENLASQDWQEKFNFGAQQTETQSPETWQAKFDLGAITDIPTNLEADKKGNKELPQSINNVPLPKHQTLENVFTPKSQEYSESDLVAKEEPATNIGDEDLEVLAHVLYSLLRSRLEFEKEIFYGYASHPPPWIHCSPKLSLASSNLKEFGQSLAEIDVNTFILERKIRELLREVYPMIQQKILIEKERCIYNNYNSQSWR